MRQGRLTIEGEKDVPRPGVPKISKRARNYCKMQKRKRSAEGSKQEAGLFTRRMPRERHGRRSRKGNKEPGDAGQRVVVKRNGAAPNQGGAEVNRVACRRLNYGHLTYLIESSCRKTPREVIDAGQTRVVELISRLAV
jgi:hypothetical protein